jgi:glycogen synthase
MDIFIRALGKLNDRLKEEKSKKSIAVFFWIPQDTHGIRIDELENKNYYRHIKNFVDYNAEEILAKIVHNFVSKKSVTTKDIFTEEFLQGIKKDILQFKRKGNAPMVTHNINDPDNDLMVKNMLALGLDNKEDDNVKVILYPVYLDRNDGLISLSYYDAMAGCHLGVFPSYYEPWGYTPLESAALGVPAVTTDLAGFGRFIAPEIKGNMNDGIFVLKRFQRSDDDVVNEFAELMYEFCKRDKHKRGENKIHAKELSELADWKQLIKNYMKAHDLAIERINKQK